jgi:hypothetical protein
MFVGDEMFFGQDRLDFVRRGARLVTGVRHLRAAARPRAAQIDMGVRSSARSTTMLLWRRTARCRLDGAEHAVSERMRLHDLCVEHLDARLVLARLVHGHAAALPAAQPSLWHCASAATA